MININLDDKKLFGNDAGEDEELEVLNAYYIDNTNFYDYFDPSERLSIASARKGMGKSALLSRLEYRLKTEHPVFQSPIVIRVKGNELIGLGDFQGFDHTHLENYWKQIICKRILIEVGNQVNIALTGNEISMITLAELEVAKTKNIINALISRTIEKTAENGNESPKHNNAEIQLKQYLDTHVNKVVWLLIDDIDAKFQNTVESQARVGSFFSAIRSLAFDYKGLVVRTTVRSDVWSCLRHLEDLDKLQQYMIPIVWTKKQMRDMLAQRILVYIKNRHPDTPESKLKTSTDYNKILDIVFNSPIEWGDNKDAKLFEAISTFSNRRPRWMGQLCRMAGRKAKENPRIKKINIDHLDYILSE